jgi:uncharacterized protein (TIGR00251 family)
MNKHLTVRVEPGAETNAVEDIGDGILKVTTIKPAAEGQANTAVVKLLRNYLQTYDAVRIVSGHKQRNKIVAIGD